MTSTTLPAAAVAKGASTARRAAVWSGVVYFVPKEFTDRVWELLMIAVVATDRRRGPAPGCCGRSRTR